MENDMTQRILTVEEHNALMRELEAERKAARDQCCCTNQGKPVEIDGVAYVFRSPSCPRHNPTEVQAQIAHSETRLLKPAYGHGRRGLGE